MRQTPAPKRHGVSAIGGNILGKQVPFDLQDKADQGAAIDQLRAYSRPNCTCR